MAHLSAAVNVITSNGPAGRCGITATAVCSVTDSPPTLMLCINRNSEMNTVFKANGRLCVNVLSGEHEEVARHFAGMTEVPMERRFALHDWREGLAGLPVLHGALANLQGRIAEVQEIGTHSVLLLGGGHPGPRTGRRPGLLQPQLPSPAASLPSRLTPSLRSRPTGGVRPSSALH